MPRLLFAFVAEEIKPKKSDIQLPFLILSGDAPNVPAEPMVRRVYKEKGRARERERAHARDREKARARQEERSSSWIISRAPP